MRNPKGALLHALAIGWLPVAVIVPLQGCSDAESSSWAWGGRGGQAGADAEADSGTDSAAAGTAGVDAGVSGQGGGTAGWSGQAGAAGQGGETPAPYVAIISPVDGATVHNPVSFSFEAANVLRVALLADGVHEIPLSWDPTQEGSHDMTYSFSELGQRSLSLHGYLQDTAPVATHTIQIKVAPPPLCDGFDSKPLQPPSVCNSANGSTSNEIPANGLFSTSWYGCYRKSDGSIYKDPYDNCEFACGPKGHCPSGQSGPECEANLKWFAADADRYGCGGLIRATNCHNGKAVVLVTLDRGPNCTSVEKKCKAPVLDMSYPAMVHLFDGKTHGGCDLARVVVEKVPDGTPLGPVP